MENNIVLKHSSNYYPQGHGLAESTNKNLICILKKTLLSHQRNFYNSLSNAFWVNRVMTKPSLGTSPYFLVYGKEVILPANLYLFALQLSQESQGSPCPTIQNRINVLLRMEEERQKTRKKFVIHQKQIKRWFDKKSTGTCELKNP